MVYTLCKLFWIEKSAGKRRRSKRTISANCEVQSTVYYADDPVESALYLVICFFIQHESFRTGTIR